MNSGKNPVSRPGRGFPRSQTLSNWSPVSPSRRIVHEWSQDARRLVALGHAVCWVVHSRFRVGCVDYKIALLMMVNWNWWCTMRGYLNFDTWSKLQIRIKFETVYNTGVYMFSIVFFLFIIHALRALCAGLAVCCWVMWFNNISRPMMFERALSVRDISAWKCSVYRLSLYSYTSVLLLRSKGKKKRWGKNSHHIFSFSFVNAPPEKKASISFTNKSWP